MKRVTFKTLDHYAKFDHHRPQTKVCPGCDRQIDNVGISKLAYTMDVCTCRENGITYDHVVEQLWHKVCLVKYMQDHPEEQTDYRYLPQP